MDESVFRIVVAAGVALATLAFVVQTVAVVLVCRIFGQIRDQVVPLVGKAGPVIDKFAPLADQATPILASARQILEENRPRVAEFSTDAAATARATRQQVECVGEILRDASQRAKVRLEQIDRSVDITVGQVEQVSDAVRRAVALPVREVNAIAAAVSAGISAYVYGRKYPVNHATQDEEMFI